MGTQDRVAVIIPGTGRSATWSGGVFAGDNQLATAARRAVALGGTYQPHEGEPVTAADDTVDGATAALLIAARGQGVVLDDAPSTGDTPAT